MNGLARDIGLFVLVGLAATLLVLLGTFLELRVGRLEEAVARRWAWRRRACAGCGRPVRNAPGSRLRADEDFGSTDRSGRFVCRSCHSGHTADPRPHP